MDRSELIQQIVANYERHGWKLRRALLTPGTLADSDNQASELLKDATVLDSDIDALWFARSSNNGREAWELRLLAEHPYALFEAFESDEAEEDREEARLEMQNRMREHAGS